MELAGGRGGIYRRDWSAARRALRRRPAGRMFARAIHSIMTGPPADARRVVMPDGGSWGVVRRHEMARILTRRDSAERRLYLLFFADDGEVRRAEVAPDYPDPATLPDAALVDVWRLAERPQ
jgi:hypothetical protein